LGGAHALRDEPTDFRKSVIRLWTGRELLTESHPNKWTSMGKDGLISIGDSIEEVVVETEAKGVGTADVTVEYLDTEPTGMTL